MNPVLKATSRWRFRFPCSLRSKKNCCFRCTSHGWRWREREGQRRNRVSSKDGQWNRSVKRKYSAEVLKRYPVMSQHILYYMCSIVFMAQTIAKLALHLLNSFFRIQNINFGWELPVLSNKRVYASSPGKGKGKGSKGSQSAAYQQHLEMDLLDTDMVCYEKRTLCLFRLYRGLIWINMD